jgi:hypothetical protein
MNRLLALSIAGLLASCSRSSGTDADTFIAPLRSYLDRRGDLCLAKNTWPIDVTQHEIDVGARNALQMPVLERLGLVSSSVAEIDVDDEGTLHHMKVRRYALTESGRRHYVMRPQAGTGLAQGDFCAAKLSLDKIVGWDLQQGSDRNARHAVVTYTYRVDAAPWTRDAELQKVFPMVAGVVRGAGTAKLQETFTLTDTGWVAVDLLGS